MKPKQIICLVLAAILLLGTLSVGVFAIGGKSGGAEVSDVFYMQIYDAYDQVLSKYQITLTGTVSWNSKTITDLSLVHIAGEACKTSYQIDGEVAVVTIVHPTEGTKEGHFVLSSNGTFSAF